MYPHWKRLSHDIVKPSLDGAEGYSNRFVCLFVYRQNSSKPTNIGTLKTLPADVKLYNDQK